MPNQPPIRPLGAFLAALEDEEIPCILIGMMVAVEQGAPLMTVARRVAKAIAWIVSNAEYQRLTGSGAE